MLHSDENLREDLLLARKAASGGGVTGQDLTALSVHCSL